MPTRAESGKKNNKLEAVVMSTSSATRSSTPDRVAWQPSLVAGIKYQEADDELILLDKRNQRVHQVDRVGASILRYCDGTHTVADIVQLLLQEFEVGPKQLSADVANFLHRLKTLELLK